MLSYYQILQVEENESQDNIKKAYRRLSKIFHPDLHNNAREANVIFNLLHEAYETLYDPVKRKNYNPKLHQTNSLNVSNEDYAALLANYKKTVNDYEQIIRIKTRREKELLNEIKGLKNGIKNSQNIDISESTSNPDIKSNPQKENVNAKSTTTTKRERRVKFWTICLKILGVLMLISLIVYIYYSPLLIILLIVLAFIIIPIYKILRG